MINKKFLLVIMSFVTISIGWITLDYKAIEVPYVSIKDLQTKQYEQQRFRLGGYVQPGSINYSDDKLTVSFNLIQKKFNLPVEHFSAAIPDLFGDSAEVIIEGKYINEVLIADNLMKY